MTIAEIKIKPKKRKRPNGEGCIRFKNGRWEAILTVGFKKDGTQDFKYFSSKSQQVALKKFNDFKEQLRKGLSPDNTQIRLEEWLDNWYNNYIIGKVGVKTRCDYESSIRCHIKPRIGRMKLTELKNMHIQRFYNDLLEKGSLRKDGKGLSPKSVRNIHVALHQALEQAVNNDLLMKNPARGVKLPASDKNTRTALTEEEEKTLIKHCYDHPWGMIILLALFSGMRHGEILGLTWADIDFENNTICISKQARRVQNFDENIKSKTLLEISNKTKTESSNRTISISPAIMEKLQEYKIAQDKTKKKWKEAYNDLNLVFCREDGNIADQKAVGTFLSDTLDKAEITTKITFHELRHTFATRASEYNSNIKSVSSILGHANSNITLNVYTHDSQEAQQAIMQNMTDKLLSA